MNHRPHNSERLEELLADRALFGLNRDEEVELNRLLADKPIDDESFDRIAAMAALAYHPSSNEDLPASLKQTILDSFPSKNFTPAEGFLRNPSESHDHIGQPSNSRGLISRRELIGWSIAAASLGGLFIDRAGLLNVSKPRMSPGELRAKLLRTESDVIQAAWKPTDDASSRGVTGDVVWSSHVQQGFLRFQGLAKNAEYMHQYQLWIFDAKRDERYPVDGGVFNIDEPRVEVVIQIDARLPVEVPTLFAVTIEKRGGVVVSKRERMLLVAEPPQKPA